MKLFVLFGLLTFLCQLGFSQSSPPRDSLILHFVEFNDTREYFLDARLKDRNKITFEAVSPYSKVEDLLSVGYVYKDAGLYLTVTNPFDENIGFKAFTWSIDSKGWIEMPSLPIKSKSTKVQHWPNVFSSVKISDFELLEN